jgi:flagellar motility protein MotE (MotC chaperone)
MTTTTCSTHTKFFDNTCDECKKEYAELKGLHKISLDDRKSDIDDIRNDLKHVQHAKAFKELTEERAKILYKDLFLQFLQTNKYNEVQCSEKAKSIVRKQCKLRNIPLWSWL